MSFRNALPQLSGGFFLTDAGLETDLIFNHGIEIREFAAHTLLSDPNDRAAMAAYFRAFLELARDTDSGFILDAPTWKAHQHWAKDLEATEEDLQMANAEAITFVAGLRDEFQGHTKPIVLNGLLGPRGDAYAQDAEIVSRDAEQYHTRQIEWLAETGVDMVTAMTFTQAEEAIGAVRAANKIGLPIAVSFTVETDGVLPTGQPLGEAIDSVDQATGSGAAYFMINCAHPDHFQHVLGQQRWARRIPGLRCNASRKSHEELDQCDALDDGDPIELGAQCSTIHGMMPWLRIFGGCCGSDLRHVKEIARAVGA